MALSGSRGIDGALSALPRCLAGDELRSTALARLMMSLDEFGGFLSTIQ